MNSCLVAVHPIYDIDEYFSDYHMEERSVAAIKDFSGDTICLTYKDGEGVRKPWGGRDAYDHVINDPNYGEVPEPVARMIVGKYDRVFVMGGFLWACVKDFYSKIQSLNEETDQKTEIVILADLLISQAPTRAKKEINGEIREVKQLVPVPSIEFETNYESKIKKSFGGGKVEVVEWSNIKQ